MYQGTIYQYNQRAEILIPERRGTSYFGPDNHKPLICYKGLNIDIDFFAKDTDRKPQSLHNRTYTCKIIDRTSGAVIINKQLILTMPLPNIKDIGRKYNKTFKVFIKLN